MKLVKLTIVESWGPLGIGAMWRGRHALVTAGNVVAAYNIAIRFSSFS